ncbi:MAG: site-specific integrase [Treponema sp.]|jgi:integrase|nr:site-specific integrase [Treponema sp.]
MAKKLPFSIIKRAGRRFFYVRFKDGTTGKYLPAISTKETTEAEAVTTAFNWLQNGIPKKDTAMPVETCSLLAQLRAIALSTADAEAVCKELRARGLLKSFVLSDSRASVDFGDFLNNFWDYDNSPYVREKLRKKHGIHRYYCKAQLQTAASYWIPFFKGRLLGDIKKPDLEAFMDSLDNGGRKLSASRKNHIVKAGTIPLRWAYAKEMIGRDITAGLVWFADETKERSVLTPELAAAVFRVEWNDERTRLASMVSMVTGMRAGEIQGLRVMDFGNDCLYVKHSWNCRDGLKPPKNNEARRVELPFPSLIQDLINIAKKNPHGVDMESFVFWGERKADKPMESSLFLDDLRAALVRAGISKEEAAKQTFHGWRHYYTSYMSGQINEKLLQAQTGHKTPAMLAHYSNHSLTGDRERVQAAQRAVFGGLLPGAAPAYAEGA